VVGYEWDRIFDNGYSPPNLQVLSTSPTLSDDNKSDVGNTTYYIAPSGAMVFATGSIYWALSLDDYRLDPDPACNSDAQSVPEMQNLMANVMKAVAELHLAQSE
jgi:hypothetical protein